MGEEVSVGLSVIFVAVGAAMSLSAGRRFLEQRTFLHRSEVATGVVVELVERSDGDDTARFPKVRFRTSSGSEVTFESEASSPAMLQVGGTVRVRYQRDQPQKAELASFSALWGTTLLFAMLGVVFLFVGFGILSGWLPVSAPARQLR
jgi:hypothetical protein